MESMGVMMILSKGDEDDDDDDGSLFVPTRFVFNSSMEIMSDPSCPAGEQGLVSYI